MQTQKKFGVAAKYFKLPIVTTTCAALLSISALANANKPIALTDAQLNDVSAGAVSIKIDAQSFAGNGSKGSARISVNSTANSDGKFTLETAIASGEAVACCNGGKTSINISRNGSGIKTGGGSVTSTIRLLNRGSYSFGLGVQIGLSSN